LSTAYSTRPDSANNHNWKDPYLDVQLNIHYLKSELNKSAAALKLFLFCYVGFVVPLQAQSDFELTNRVAELIRLEKYKKAFPIAEQLLQNHPNDMAARYNHAVICFHLEKYKESLADYQFLSELYPKNDSFLFQTGNLYEHLDSLKLAEKYYTKALDIVNRNYLYFFKRGTCYLKLSWYDQAIEDFDQALRLNEQHPNSLHNRGIAYYRKGNHQKACEDWCQALLLGNPASAIQLDRNCKTYPAACLPSK
jgi:tetratricopeptide (TPR) repeat protein